MVSEFLTKQFYTFKTHILLHSSSLSFQNVISCVLLDGICRSISALCLLALAKYITAKSVPQISLLTEAIVTHLLYKCLVSTPTNPKYALFVCFLEYNGKYQKPGSWLFSPGAL